MAPDFDFEPINGTKYDIKMEIEGGTENRRSPIEKQSRDEIKCYPTLPPPEDWPELKIEKILEGENKKYCETQAQGRPVEISGKQVGLYKTVLENLGYSTNLEKFTVDSRGDSQELREELGKGYLDNRVIIVSEAQLNNLSLLSGNPSYVAQVVSQVPKELVKKITPHEALTGKINLLYGQYSVTGIFDEDFKDQPSSVNGLHIILALDTLTESVKKINSLNNKIGFIKENSLKSLDKNLVEGILAEIHPLITRYGSIEPVKNSNIIDQPLKENMLCFSHKGYDIFFFDGKSPFVVYHGKEVESKTLVALPSYGKSEIIDFLVKNEFLKIEKDIIFAALEAMAKSSLENRAPECLNTTGFHFYKVFKKYKDIPEVVDNLNKAGWHLLRDVCYGNIEFSTLPLEIKKKITRPRDKAVEAYLRFMEEKTLKA